MKFVVKSFYDGHVLTVATETAKEAFAKSIEWHFVERFTNVCISDGIKNYTIAEFASAMALTEIRNTVGAASGVKPKAK
jgi:hypothetical protein